LEHYVVQVHVLPHQRHPAVAYCQHPYRIRHFHVRVGEMRSVRPHHLVYPKPHPPARPALVQHLSHLPSPDPIVHGADRTGTARQGYVPVALCDKIFPLVSARARFERDQLVEQPVLSSTHHR
jgi:hypothetical protein